MNEALYCSNLNYTLDSSNNSQCFRILFCPKLKIFTINLIEANEDRNLAKDYYDNYNKFMKNMLKESYQDMEQENEQQDEPLRVYLKRNKKKVIKKIRECVFSENGLSIKVKNNV